ncbi:FHA domain-containing protein [Leptolyngbya ohadii]|uniref:FHA domain-containing protein n=1 Tax=Leptolyngbya ohadii TaxID=1962290 RepID=UPI000B5A0863|nr:FHA domain-containing protein [Leptolyngbya ohadii]
MLKFKSVNFEHQQFQVHCLEQTYAGQTEWIVGRNPSCDLVLTSPDVSRVHGRVLYCDGTYYFADAGSTAGSLLNGTPVSANNLCLLRSGDLLQLGEMLLYVEELSPPALVAAPVLSQTRPQIPEQHWDGGDITCRCCRIIQETPDVKTFSLVAEPPVLFSFMPGQFVNLEVEIDGQTAVRCYSISSSPTRPYHLDLTVKRYRSANTARSPGAGGKNSGNHSGNHSSNRNFENKEKAPPGLVSNWLHDCFKVGDRVRLLGGAMGQFTCLPNVPAKMLLLSAGSGITPVMSMARWVQDMLLDTDIVFLHSARTLKDLIFRSELSAMAAQMPNFHLAVTLTQPPPTQAWMGLTGRISRMMMSLVVPDVLERAVYVCGAEGFTQDIRDVLESMSFPMENYHAESFGGTARSVSSKSSQTISPSVSSSSSHSSPSDFPTIPFHFPVSQFHSGHNGGHSNGHTNGHTGLAASSVARSTESSSVSSSPASSASASSTSASSKSASSFPAPSGSSASTSSLDVPIVKFAQSGQEVLADGNLSILEVAEQAGVQLRHACRTGACGACKVAAREGKVHYETRPVALTADDEAAGYVLACVGYPVDRLVLEA